MGRMVRIFEDMFIADQWIEQSTEDRRKADSTWFYEGIFNKYGYTFKDYDASMNYYIDKPDKFAKVFRKVKADLMEASEDFDRLMSEEEVKGVEEFKRYVRKEFGVDSLRWTAADTLILWPEAMKAEADTLTESISDTLLTEIEDASRRDSIRTDKKPEIRKLPGDQSATIPGEDM